MKDKKAMKKIGLDTVIMVIALACSTGIGYLFGHLGYQETATVVIYVLAVILIACFTNGYFYGIIASVIATLSYNFFFTIPIYTFNVSDPTYIITFLVMTITAVLTSTIMSKLKANTLLAKNKESETKFLYLLSNKLSDAKDKQAVTFEGLDVLQNITKSKCRIYLFDDMTIMQDENATQVEYAGDINELKKLVTNIKEKYIIKEDNVYFPLTGQNILFGAVEIVGGGLSDEVIKKADFLRLVVDNIALAFDRILTLEANQKALRETEKEKYKSNLLRAISHDIRTPLTGIMGTAEILSCMTDKSGEEHKMADEIYANANWLNSMVENILSLTRLRDGNIKLIKRNEFLEEVIGSAIERIQKLYPKCRIYVKMPDNPIEVPIDAMLIKQVMINLMDNAVKHCGEDVSIIITACETVDEVTVKVADNGKGIDEDKINRLFDIFYSEKEELKKGVGLGLTICKTITEAHGGTIDVKNSEGGGAEFTFILPKTM